MTKVAILGAGNLAFTLAGDLLLRHKNTYEVTVWAPENHRLSFNEVAELGCLYLRGSANDGAFKPNLEDDLGRAVSSAEFIVLAVPTLGHESILNALALFDLSASFLVALPGSGTTLIAKQILSSELSPKAIIETTTSPYACRRSGATINMLGIKSAFEISASEDLSSASKDRISTLFPNRLEWYPNIASIFFSNANPVAHPAGILNAKEAIQCRLRPLPNFYGKFVAEAIERVNSVDAERLAIVRALGLKSETDFDYSKKWYGTDAPGPREFYEIFEGYADIETPTTMNHRYLTEDVKYIMVPWVAIAKICNVDVKTMESIVHEASRVLEENLSQTGRTLRSMGLDGAGPEEILRALNGAETYVSEQWL